MNELQNIYSQLNTLYSRVPEISCEACGKCCISPHMTLVEFCYMFIPMRENSGELVDILSRSIDDHQAFPGQLKCRFQSTDNRCSIHSHRPLACRMHGHAAMEEMGQMYNVHCKKTKPIGKPLLVDDVYFLLDAVNDLNNQIYDHYKAPYWVCGMTSEVWLTIAFTDNVRPLFKELREIILRECNLKDFENKFNRLVRLEEKLVLVDQFNRSIDIESPETLASLLNRIKDDFPETGTYYYFEAEYYAKQLKEIK